MASQEAVAAVILCVWRRRHQRYRAAYERDSARRRRLVAFYQHQAQELATIKALVTRRTLLSSVLQTRTVWVRKRSYTFLDRIVAGWNEAEWKRNFMTGRPTFHFLCTAFSVLELPLDIVLALNVQQKSDFTFIRERSFFLTPRTRLDAGSTHLRKRVEFGCKTRVDPSSRGACERCI